MPLIPAVGGRDRQISMSLSQPGLHSEHQNSQGCTVRPCLQNKVIFQTWSQGKWNIKTEPTPKTEQTWAKEMAQWVAIKPDHLSWIPGTTHMLKEKTNSHKLFSNILTLTYNRTYGLIGTNFLVGEKKSQTSKML